MAIRNELILLPLLAQVLLTILVYVALAVAKSRAVKRGQVDPERRALHADAWPESVQKINNNIRNQFEVPVLFYVLVIALLQLGAAGLAAQLLAWLFVASRAAHAWVHTGSNRVPIRRPLFMFGCVIVLGLLVLTALAVSQ
jgi:hypothetical protein